MRPHTTSKQWNVPGRYGSQGAESAGAQHPAAWRASPLLMQKKPTFVPDSEAFSSYIGEGFLIPELKEGSEASKDEQADSSSENNVGNGALFVIGLRRFGDAIALFLRNWEVAR